MSLCAVDYRAMPSTITLRFIVIYIKPTNNENEYIDEVNNDDSDDGGDDKDDNNDNDTDDDDIDDDVMLMIASILE